MNKNSNLNNAKKNANDEYYTIYSDIEKELSHYKEFFNNKVIYLNADSLHSNFAKYFISNIKNFNIKKLLISGFDINTHEGINAIITPYSNKVYNNNGDFEANLDFLREADIVITNPPFSLFRRWFDLINTFNKKYIFIAPLTVMKYPAVFDLIMHEKISMGYTRDLGMYFMTADNGKPHISATWFTNLPIGYTVPYMVFTETYRPENYEFFDNFMINNQKILNINNVLTIPDNYYGIMAVPLTAIKHINRSQFRIFGTVNGYVSSQYNMANHVTVNGKEKYVRLLIQRIQ